MSRDVFQEEVGIAKNGVIHPSSKYRVAWDLLLGLLIVYTVFVVPYRISFLQVLDDACVPHLYCRPYSPLPPTSPPPHLKSVDIPHW